MIKSVIGAMALLVVGGVGIEAQLSSQQTDRIRASGEVLQEVRGEPDKDIPRGLWEKARCVVVIPSLKKGAVGFGAEYGRGMMSCRDHDGWSAPVFMQLEKGSWGFQIGGESIDLVLLVMNDAGMRKMMQDKVSLGADASVAAGPVGRNAAASTDVQMGAEVLSYSRAQGLFAGIDVSGGVLRPDTDANRDLYGHEISASEVLRHETKVPEQTLPFMHALRK